MNANRKYITSTGMLLKTLHQENQNPIVTPQYPPHVHSTTTNDMMMMNNMSLMHLNTTSTHANIPPGT
jgi:hypothetical protein